MAGRKYKVYTPEGRVLGHFPAKTPFEALQKALAHISGYGVHGPKYCVKKCGQDTVYDFVTEC